jgi:bifunctional non-homologous end joining protein LigD
MPTVARVEVSRPDKLLWPDLGITKLDYVRYLDAVADRMLPWLADRPLSLIRAPDGASGHRYFQKHAPDYTPGWIRTVRLPAETSRREEVRYYLCDDRRTLAWLGNQAALEFHPSVARRDRLDRPDLLVIDVDPPPGGFDGAIRVARMAREILERHDVPTLLKTTGGKGLHVVVPVERRYPTQEIRAAADGIAAAIAAAIPDVATTAFAKAKRGGRVYVDASRTGAGQTVIAPFSPRAREGAPVAFPISWDELDRVEPGRFHVGNAAGLLGGPGPKAWAGATPLRLPRALRQGDVSA